MSRFEEYVNEKMAELTAPRRRQLEDAYEAEKAKIRRQKDKYVAMLEAGVAAVVGKALAQAAKDGCDVDAGEVTEKLNDYVKGSLRDKFGPCETYDYATHGSVWPEGTPVRKAQDALRAFDELRRKEARRLVVYKMDLKMKPEAFEKMLAEAAAKVNRE